MACLVWGLSCIGHRVYRASGILPPTVLQHTWKSWKGSYLPADPLPALRPRPSGSDAPKMETCLRGSDWAVRLRWTPGKTAPQNGLLDWDINIIYISQEGPTHLYYPKGIS